MTITINTLVRELQLVGFPQPHAVHVGFMTPREISAVSDVPAFDRVTTTNAQIATNVMTQPVKEWQRPLDGKRIGDIAAIFAARDELMPNAVLLCQNLNAVPANQVAAAPSGFNKVPHLWEVSIQAGKSSPNRALWIIDGQHRIASLNQAVPDEPIPVVLLLNNREKYAPNQVAKIFAQVTTGAEALKEEHGEWMAYAFTLKKYADPSTGRARQSAMATVIEMCRVATLPDGSANPFYSNIQFNPDPLHAANLQFGNGIHGGFGYTCPELQKLLYTYYFVNATTPLPPATVAGHLGMAVSALSNVIGSPMQSVFFGPDSRDVVRDAFLIGILAHLTAAHPCQCKSTSDWTKVLQSLNFQPPASWDFHWAASYSGPAGTSSRAIATNTFREIFGQNVPALPKGVSDIPSYLKGANAEVTITVSAVTASGKGSTSPKKQFAQTVTKGYVGNIDANVGGTAKYFAKITGMSPNVCDVNVIDNNARGNQKYLTDDFSRGVDLTIFGSSGRLDLTIEFVLFGGNRCDATPTIVWK